MTKPNLVALLVIICLQLLGCRQSRLPDAPVASTVQQAFITPIPTYTPTVQLVAQQQDSGSVASEVDLGKSSATPTAKLVSVPTSPTATATATRRPTATATRQPTVTPTPEYYVTGGANLRSGPGTNYDIVGGRQPNDVLSPIARTADGEWIQIDENVWIWSGLVEGDVGNLPVTLIPEPTAIRPPSPASPPIPVPTREVPTKIDAHTCLAYAEVDYIELLLEHIATVWGEIDTAGDVIISFTKNVNLLKDPLWIERKNAMLESMSYVALSFSLAAMFLPDSLAELHSFYLEGMGTLLGATLLLQIGFEEADSEMLLAGINALDEVADTISVTIDIIESICA